MIFASALVTERELASTSMATRATGEPDVARACQLLCEQMTPQLPEGSIDVAVLFLSHHFATEAQAILKHLRQSLNAHVLIGCTAEGVIGSQIEVENGPALSLIAAHLPGIRLVPFALEARSVSEWTTLLSSYDLFHEIVGAPRDPRVFIVLADPFSTPLNSVRRSGGVGMLDAFNLYFEGVPVVGGIASGAQFPGANALIMNDHVLNNGAVGVAICGDIDVSVVVSQGCRPIGRPFKVTKARQNFILELDGKPPVEQIQAMIETLDDTDKDLLSHGLYVGRAIHTPSQTTGEDSPMFGRGDFLVRGVIGGDPSNGSIAISDVPEIGETVQFHVRDADTAAEDFDLLLAPQAFYDVPAGGLLFSCNGRGTRMFDHPHADVTLVQHALGSEQPVHLAGFFCGGEIGPIGKRAFLHGHTASLVLFRPS
jgi:small ligand-binding sensory domain FIST